MSFCAAGFVSRSTAWCLLLSVTLSGCNVVQTTPNAALPVDAAENGPAAKPPPVTPSPGVAPGPAAPNRAPAISGTPLTSVNVDMPYNFKPLATDASGLPLTFSIRNLPDWASFDTKSGALTGTPTAGNVAEYPGIGISVSDGEQEASLPPFTLEVTQAANGSATINWTAPTRNTDGSPLTILAGSHLYCGTSADDLTRSIQIANPGLTTYVLGNLSPATWFFGVKAYSSSGTESTFSNVASKTVR